MDISRRQRLILEKIIGLYSGSGDPVGSRFLGSVIDEFSVSSATLRNEMAALTSLGLLEQPHTSAGRVPSVMGYRYYVENLLKDDAPDREEEGRIRSAVAGMDNDPDRAAEEAAHLLSEITGFAAIATTPRGGDVKVTHFEVLRTGRFNVAVLAVSSVGGVRTRVCRTERELSDADLSAVKNLLNARLVFVSSEDIDEKRLTAVCRELGEAAEGIEPIVKAAGAIVRSASETRMYTDGQQKLLRYHELDGHIGEMLELFSDSRSLEYTLGGSEPLKVFIGEGPGALGSGALSMVVARYRAAGGRYGAVAVAGPVRMNYRRVIPRLSLFRDCLSDNLTSPV